jgi:hypothetical protein
MNEMDWFFWLAAGAGLLVGLSAILLSVTILMVMQARAYLRDARSYPHRMLQRETDINGRPRRERI